MSTVISDSDCYSDNTKNIFMYMCQPLGINFTVQVREFKAVIKVPIPSDYTKIKVIFFTETFVT